MAGGMSVATASAQVAPSTPPPVRANFDPQGRTIDRIEFEGLQTIDATGLRDTIGIKPGDKWDRDEVTAACRRLAETQKFDGVPFADARMVGNQMVLVFIVRERPYVISVDFVGNQQFDNGDLLKEIPIGVGSTVSDFLIRQSQQIILQKYREAGYANASVDVDADALANEKRVLFRISEGPRVKVKEIRFEGNHEYGDKRLQALIETQTALWLFRTGAFNEDTVKRDVATIKSFYVDRGFLNAQVGYRVDLEEGNQSDLIVVFQIDEGIRHAIRSITFEGNEAISTDALRSMIETQENSFFDGDVLKKDRETILTEYGRRGYIYASITTSQTFADEPGFVNVKFSITEGGPYNVGQVVIRGNRKTQDHVIRRELRILPESTYNAEAAKKSEQRLIETQLFNDVKITPEGDEPGVRNALVNVEEADTTRILFGVGVTTNSGIVGSISIENRNFDLFDTPRTAKEFFKGRSFTGAGQTLRLRLEPGTEFTRGRLEFREPYLFDKPLGFGMAVYGFERGRPEYDERRVGFNVSLDKRIEEGPLEGWAGELALRVENVNIGGTDWLTAEEIRDDKGSNLLTTVKATVVRDKTDSRWLPSTGDRLKVAVEQAGALGGDHAFTRVTADYDRYWTVKTDSFGRKHIFQVGASAGDILGDAPVFEKFFAGGIGSIRGFEYRGISPRAGFHDDRVGGDFMLLANAQYSFPVAGDNIRGITFLDMGTVEDDFGISDWRASIGVGLRIYVKYFGPIPLSFDLALPVSSQDLDDEQVFSFAFGATF